MIVMGGLMSVNDETKHPWLVDEKRFIRDCIQTGSRFWACVSGPS